MPRTISEYGITEDSKYSKTFPAANCVPLALPVFQVKLCLHYIRLLRLLQILFCTGLKDVPSVQEAYSVW